MDVHAEDAFIAEFLARVTSRSTPRGERELARAIAIAALDHEPELAYPWGRSSALALLSAPLAIAQQRGVERGAMSRLRAELLAWLTEIERLDADVPGLSGDARIERPHRSLLAA